MGRLMGIYAIKPWFREALSGAARSLGNRGVTPDQITMAGLIAGVVAVGAYAAAGSSPFFLLAIPVLAFVRTAANAMDGLVAEMTGTGRPAGELFNETADRLADAAFIAGTALIPGVEPVLAVAALAVAELGSFVGVTAKAAGASRRYDGPMGKPDRMIVVGLAGVLASFMEPGTVFELALAVMTVGALATAANRYVKAHKELDRAG